MAAPIRLWISLLAFAFSSWMLAGVAKAVTVAAPTISGTPREGQVLTAVNSVPNPATAVVTDTWLVCTPTCPTTGPTGPTYTLTAADVGHTIEVVETATDNSVTPAVSASATSAPTAAVLPLPPTNSTLPTVAPLIAQQGQILTVTHGSWTNSPTAFTDQWESCSGATCIPVGTLNSLTYVPAVADIGRTIKVLETASDAGGPSLAASSAPTAAVVPAIPTNSFPPLISGILQQGQTLTLTHGIWTNNPTSILDQWLQCDAIGANCVPIPGQTGGTYTLGPGDVGHTLAVTETATNAGNGAAPGLSAVSVPKGPVTATSFTSVVAFSANAPTTNQTVTLVATVSSSSGNASPSGTLTFFNGSTAIGSCMGKPVRGGLTITVICQAAFAAGTAQISAVYQPGSGSLVSGSASAPAAVAIGRDSTSVSLAVTKQVAVGDRALYSATLVLPVSNSGPIDPTGSITFLDGGQPIGGCQTQPLSSLTATCAVSYGSLGAHDISAVYGGDSNFAPSASPTSSVQIVKPSNAPAPALNIVKSTLKWTFYYHPTYTQVILLKAFGIVKGTTVLVTCRGGGCPFKKLHVKRPNGSSTNLLPAFRGHQLRAGSRITFRFMHSHWVGKYYSFTIRPGRPPLGRVGCLAVGRTVPGAGC